MLKRIFMVILIFAPIATGVAYAVTCTSYDGSKTCDCTKVCERSTSDCRCND